MLDYLIDSVGKGGWVMLPLFLTGLWGLYLVFDSYADFGRDKFGDSFLAFEKNLVRLAHQGDFSRMESLCLLRKNTLGNSLYIGIKNRGLAKAGCHLKMDSYRNEVQPKMERKHRTLGVIAAAAPLLGLLGTVSGMIHTFTIITLFGQSNATMLAGGISEALMTTQSGLALAFPLLVFRYRLDEKSKRIFKESDRQI